MLYTLTLQYRRYIPGPVPYASPRPSTLPDSSLPCFGSPRGRRHERQQGDDRLLEGSGALSAVPKSTEKHRPESQTLVAGLHRGTGAVNDSTLHSTACGMLQARRIGRSDDRSASESSDEHGVHVKLVGLNTSIVPCFVGTAAYSAYTLGTRLVVCPKLRTRYFSWAWSLSGL